MNGIDVYANKLTGRTTASYSALAASVKDMSGLTITPQLHFTGSAELRPAIVVVTFPRRKTSTAITWFILYHQYRFQ